MKLNNLESETNKLEVCKKTRAFAAKSFATVLKKALRSKTPISELQLRDLWLKELRKNTDIFSDGWYAPPPYGICILIGGTDNKSRVNYDSLRPEHMWPRADIFLSKTNNVIYAYASPVDRKTGIIGDIGMSIYLGTDEKVKKHLQNCLEINQKIFEGITLGMKLKDVYALALKIINSYGLKNSIFSITDPTYVNIGHTIPASYEDWTPAELKILRNKQVKSEDIAKMISSKRKYVNSAENLEVRPNMAFTIEPRMISKGKSNLPLSSYHAIITIDKNGNKELLTNFEAIFKLAGMDYMNRKKKLTYAETGDDYDTKDPIKKLAQVSATKTGENLKKWGFAENTDSRGESGYVWKQGKTLMAAVAEQLGTKNLVADAMRAITKKTYYDVIAHDTVATIINDLTSVGAQPLVLHAHWAIESNDWLADEERMKDLIRGWKSACDLAGASWGGGETPTLKGIITPGTVALGGSAIGYISSPSRLITDKNVKVGDRILLLKSTGINANGLSLARAIAKKLPKGYATKMKNGEMYGEAILKKTNIYTKTIQDLLNAGIKIHYLSNITGHGFRKLMRGRGNFTYVVEKMFEPQKLFNFIQKHANLTNRDMYDEFNMGNDYAIYLPEKYVKKAQTIVKKNKFQSIDAGYVEHGPRRVIIKPKNITFEGDRLDLR